MRRIVLSILMAFAVGCSSHSGSSVVGTPDGSFSPYVRQQQGNGPWLTFPMGGSRIIEPTQAVAAGFDENMWVCDNGAVDRVDMSGHVATFAVPACAAITRNPDHHLYFWEAPEQLGTIDSEGNISSLVLDGGTPIANVLASDSSHNLWKPGTDIDRIDPTGHVSFKQIVFPPGTGGKITGLVLGSDGQMWFSCVTADRAPCIGEIKLDMSSYMIWLLPAVSNPIAGSDGGIWFSEGNSIARVDTGTKSITTYSLPQTYNVIWGTQATDSLLAFVTRGRQLVDFNIRKHKIAGKSDIPGMVDATNSFVTLGTDLNLWVPTDDTCLVKHGCFATVLNINILRSITTDPTSFSLSVGEASPLTAKERLFTKPLTAQTSNSAIASVTSNGTDSWTVTAVGSGSCTITVSDTKGNYVDVPVTVN